MKFFEFSALMIICFVCCAAGYLYGTQNATIDIKINGTDVHSALSTKPKDCACCVLSPSERKCKSNCIDCKCPRAKIGKELPCGTTCKCTDGKICATVCECGEKNGKCVCPPPCGKTCECKDVKTCGDICRCGADGGERWKCDCLKEKS